jgi:Tol biopolymer transport system component
MPDLKDVFHEVTRLIEPDPDPYTALQEQRQRSVRSRKIAALALAAVIVAAMALAAGVINRGREGSAPATQEPSSSALRLVVVGVDGSIQGSIPSLPSGTMHADVSPVGSTMAFVIRRGTGSAIATMNLDGSGFRIITDDAVVADLPRWSPDGSRLLYCRIDPRGLCHLMVMNADGTDPHEVRGARSSLEILPADWSPDGSLILYTYLVRWSRDLATVPTIGGRSHRLTATSRIAEGHGVWSPDGRTIAFTHDAGFGSEVWLIDADGGRRRRLASLPGMNAQAPEWSPDGSTIAFIGSSRIPRDRPDGVFVVDIGSGHVTRVMQGVARWARYEGRATWLPGGDALLVLTTT